MPIQQLKNFVSTTLASSCTNVATTISAVSASGFPTAGNFMIRIDDAAPATTFEYMEGTAVSGTTFTVSRGQEGTTGIAHNAGAKVGLVITAAMLSRGYVQPVRTRAYLNGAQTLTATGWQKVNIDTVSYESPVAPSAWDLVTNHRWICPLAGYYLVFATTSVSTGARSIAGIYLNGTQISSGTDANEATANVVASVNGDIVSCALNDYLEMWVYNPAGTPGMRPGTGLTWMNIHYLSAP